MHDHNLKGLSSGGKYPQGPLTIFDVVDKNTEIKNGSANKWLKKPKK